MSVISVQLTGLAHTPDNPGAVQLRRRVRYVASWDWNRASSVVPACQTVTALLLGAFLFLPGCGQRPGAVPEVRIALTGGALGHLPIPLAESLGYFEQEGVRVSLAAVPAGAKVMEAMMGGSAEIGASSLEAAAQLTAEGQPIKAFLLELYGLPFPLVVSPKASREVAALEDLRGAVVGVSSFGSQTHMVLNYLLFRHGIGPEAVNTSGIGIAATAVAAIKSGKVDAGFVNPAGFELLRRHRGDLKVLFDPLDTARAREIFGTERYPSHVLCARADWLANNPVLARKVARAVLRGLRHLRDRPVAESVARLPQAYRSTEPGVDAAALERWLPMFTIDGVFPDGADSYDAVLRVTAYSVEKLRLASIDARAIYTNEFVKAAATKDNP